MAARAISFARGYLRQWWHCVTTGHARWTKRSVTGRVLVLGCDDCPARFWQRGWWR